MCGILAIIQPNKSLNMMLDIYDGLRSLQHRGQDGFGVCCDDRTLRREGIVSDFKVKYFDSFDQPKHCFMGHVRYRTNGSSSKSNLQPIVLEDKFRVSVVHNGNITNLDTLKNTDEYKNFSNNTYSIGTSDTYVLTVIFLQKLQSLMKSKLTHDDVYFCCKYLLDICQGSFSLCILIEHYGLIVLRDNNGIRPLVFGKKGDSVMFASESCTLQHLDYNLSRSVKPGEIIIFPYTQLSSPLFYHNEKALLKPCLFEYIYFARPDSIIDNISVYDSRYKMGKILGNQIQKVLGDSIHTIDYIVPVPVSSMIFALGVNEVLQIPVQHGFVKNNFIPRTFIMENHEIIRQSVRKKLHIVECVFRNKNVIIIDDSIVRGNTSKHIIKLANQCGVKSIVFCSAAPPIYYPNNYGIYIPTCGELIASNKTNDEIAKELQVKKVIYNDLFEIVECLQDMNNKIVDCEKSMFTRE